MILRVMAGGTIIQSLLPRIMTICRLSTPTLITAKIVTGHMRIHLHGLNKRNIHFSESVSSGIMESLFILFFRKESAERVHMLFYLNQKYLTIPVTLHGRVWQRGRHYI